ncbi:MULTISPECIES: hypothetical protein [unclassified Streptomyces]|uniref:hypothetical protein n=1 Tax=unclassified Streptomyces TaxID=2593676 RepID=UPI0035D97FC8
MYELDGTTLAHSDPAQLGGHVVGPYTEAAVRRPFTRAFQGVLGLGTTLAALLASDRIAADRDGSPPNRKDPDASWFDSHAAT